MAAIAVRYATWMAAALRSVSPRLTAAAQRHAVPQRRGVGERTEPGGQLADREERAGEQHQRHGAEAEHVVHRRLVRQGDRPGRGRGGERHAEQRRGGQQQHRPPGPDQPERGHHDHEAGGVHRDPHRDEQQVPPVDVGRAQHRRAGRQVDLVPVDAAEDREHRVGQPGVHRLHAEHGGRDEHHVGHAAERRGPVLVDERAEAVAHRAQVEQRPEHRRPDRGPPGPPVHHQPAAERPDRQRPGTGQLRPGVPRALARSRSISRSASGRSGAGRRPPAWTCGPAR